MTPDGRCCKILEISHKPRAEVAERGTILWKWWLQLVVECTALRTHAIPIVRNGVEILAWDDGREVAAIIAGASVSVSPLYTCDLLTDEACRQLGQKGLLERVLHRGTAGVVDVIHRDIAVPPQLRDRCGTITIRTGSCGCRARRLRRQRDQSQQQRDHRHRYRAGNRLT